MKVKQCLSFKMYTAKFGKNTEENREIQLYLENKTLFSENFIEELAKKSMIKWEIGTKELIDKILTS